MGRIKRQISTQSSDQPTDKSEIDSLRDMIFYLKHGKLASLKLFSMSGS